MPHLQKAILAQRTLVFVGLLVAVMTGNPATAQVCSEVNIQTRFEEMLGTTRDRDAALPQILSCGEQSVPVLVAALNSDDRNARDEAVAILRQLVDQTNPTEPWSLSVTTDAVTTLSEQLHTDGSFDRRESAAQALGILMPQLTDSLSQTAVNSLIQALEAVDNPAYVRIEAVKSLGRAPDISSQEIALLAQYLRDPTRLKQPLRTPEAVSAVQAEIAYTLAKIDGQEAIAALLMTFHSESDPILRQKIVAALGNLQEPSSEVLDTLVEALSGNPAPVRIQASASLQQLVKASPDLAGPMLVSQLETLTQALSDESQDVLHNLVMTLDQLTQQPNLSSETAALYRTHLREGLAILRNQGNARPEDIDELQQALDALQESTHWTRFLWNLLTILGGGWIVHALVWLGLVFVYPNSPQVQAIFFWNPKVRKILGLWYVTPVLVCFPFLRSILFTPFKTALVADADLENFETQAYFPDLSVVLKGQRQTQLIHQAIPKVQGQIVLEGDSGLGKTMFLRHQVKTSQRLGVYLPAKKCAAGVMEAIQVKLKGPAQDPNFLHSLIYNGALDIYIDGLNEVTPDARAQITLFVENYFEGNIVMTTQSLDWSPPSTATIYVLQPLNREQVENFLISRQAAMPADAALQGADYIQACRDYLVDVLERDRSEDEKLAMWQTLSNPMDLTVMAQMIADGKTPDLLNLRQQQYDIMAAYYAQIHLNQEFPLAEFAEMAYQMRLEGIIAIPSEPWFKELRCLERYRMVLSRRLQDAQDEVTTEWYFRHDKIQDFFVVQTFLGRENDRPNQHISDPRFRGVYLLLANLLPLEAAQQLREKLIQYAANTHDHTVSDQFIQRLQARQSP